MSVDPFMFGLVLNTLRLVLLRAKMDMYMYFLSISTDAIVAKLYALYNTYLCL
jgi:hypothetical protein